MDRGEDCDLKITSKVELKRHMVSHTYKFLNKEFQCEKCEFTGNNEWTMQMHNGKCHQKNNECGLCNYEAKDIENLDLHLTTCEIYECDECEFIARNLSDFKRHILENKTTCNLRKGCHVKLDRSNEKEASFKEYKQS